MAPAQPQQIIVDRIGQKALLAEIQHRNRTMSFGELGAIRAMDQRHMGEMRAVPAHRVIDHALAESIGQMVIAADHMGDAHIMIIHHHGMQIGGRAIAAQDDHVIQFAIRHAHFTLHHIRHNRLAFQGRFDANGKGLARLLRPWLLIPPAAVITRRAAFGGSLFAHFGQFLGRCPAPIGLAHSQQRFRYFTMPRFTLCLKDRRFIGRKPQPSKAIQDLFHRFTG